jgi:superfamily II DNA or RNA helicase
MPYHPRTSELVKSGLFADVASFADLENRIANLGNEKLKGDAFEVFAEAYLRTQRKHDAEKIWPSNTAPLNLLERLGLSLQDYGVDGVFLTVLGHHNVYQVKFRSSRSPLTWRELSTFMGLADSPHIHSRVLITNCDDLPEVLNDRQGFFCIRGSDLDRLQPEDLQAIQSWLAESVFEIPKKQPLEHQTEALAALVPALRNENRVSAIMACGTGKTLVALWAVEQLQTKQVLVLLPSLTLLRQTLHDWLHETKFPKLAYLCVCSDSTVKEGIDALATRQSDLDFEVSTNPSNVRSFLDAPFDGPKVIFSTYQSAAVVGQAVRPGEIFDIGIFDEAHKTAGREGRNYAFALNDSNLLIRKRLFLTATPRHYNPHRRDQEGEAQVVFSMDNPQVYGRQAVSLTFGEAARRDIICNYKVIISVITTEMVTNELLSRGEVIVNGDIVRARQVANQIAVRDAVEKYGADKIFTFHKTVKSASSFVANGSEGIQTHLPYFETYHVNGEMPTAQRERLMQGFREAKRAVMSNARCLTEGVDVPAVDMVAFLSPRRSRVDIVQATGRAMRRSPGKTVGYVLVPLYVELLAGESVDDAVTRADFDEVWDVLQSLQEQDETLAELIREAGEQEGRSRGMDDRGLADHIDFGGPRLSLENLRVAVQTRCLENLYSSWDTWVGRLKEFKERFGHCNVGIYGEESALGRWASSQRTCRTRGALSDARISRLDQLGFVWDYQKLKAEETWRKWYQELEVYVREHGDANVPRRHSNTKLASWVWIQRQRRKRTSKSGGSVDVMSDEQAALLEKLGFRWDARTAISEKQWSRSFQKLATFSATHGHCEVDETVDPRLANWSMTQRAARSSGEIAAERIALLDSIGFTWVGVSPEQKWHRMYDELKQYYGEHGHSNVPNPWERNLRLANWVSAQRQIRQKGAIASNRVRLLDEIAFVWKSRTVGTWEDRLAEVVAFKGNFGHCNIPVNFPDNPKLGGFVNQMRSQRRRGALSEDRVARLDEVGFVWSARNNEQKWNRMYDSLKHCHATHGDSNVPFGWKENPKLAHWVSFQRQLRKKSMIEDSRIELLDKVGFVWDARPARGAGSSIPRRVIRRSIAAK